MAESYKDYATFVNYKNQEECKYSVFSIECIASPHPHFPGFPN